MVRFAAIQTRHLVETEDVPDSSSKTLIDYSQAPTPNTIYVPFIALDNRRISENRLSGPVEHNPIIPIIGKVSYQIRYGLIPDVFLSLQELLTSKEMQMQLETDDIQYSPLDRDLPNERYVDVLIENTSFTRALVGYASSGFTMWNFLRTMKQSLVTEFLKSVVQKDDSNNEADEDDENQPFPAASYSARNGFEGNIKRAIPSFYCDMISINLQGITNLIYSPNVWAYVLSLQHNPNFPYGGIDVRVSFCTLKTGIVSYHIMNISDPKTELSKLEAILRCLGSRSGLKKLLGVKLYLSEEEHSGADGKIASYVIAYFYRLAPRQPYFHTPDFIQSAKKPPILPSQIIESSLDEIRKDIEIYHNKLDLSWSSDQVNKITEEYENLKSMQEAVTAVHEEEDFEKAWSSLKEQTPTLYNFYGTLSIFYTKLSMYQDEILVKDFSSSHLQRLDMHRIATEVVSHAIQYNEISYHIRSSLHV